MSKMITLQLLWLNVTAGENTQVAFAIKIQDKEERRSRSVLCAAYVKCVSMSGGLTDKEINQTYVKVLQCSMLDSIFIYRAKSNLIAMVFKLYHSSKYTLCSHYNFY